MACAVKNNAACEVCRNMLAAGDPVWEAIQVNRDSFGRKLRAS
jgi:hypothetical protein